MNFVLWKGYSVSLGPSRNDFIKLLEQLYTQDYEATHRIIKFFFERLLGGRGITAEWVSRYIVNHNRIYIFEYRDRSAVLETTPIFVMGAYRTSKTIFLLDFLENTNRNAIQKLLEESERRLERSIKVSINSSSKKEASEIFKYKELFELLKNCEGFQKAENQLGSLYDFVNEIIDLRIKRKYSQTKLSEVSGIPSSTIALLEIGKHNPSFKSMNAISEALGGKLHISTRGRRTSGNLFG
ncbi:helix-turn-helix transcriptional regulator [Mesotoga sp. H07.pep.5.3]|uniref:helix-turn-helix transcriptional regulator n=1 Tax=Mesotoga sp. H07.pep.5.3 TaxID=1421003 RepID=UPI000C18DC60|nr:helix-turn-helix transcriptional regulator [Mesotoga sp. H07.pep.5.3]PIJ62945.1 hypothetical protein V513_03170 [Mesotoga sp. H07.pep.5.3]